MLKPAAAQSKELLGDSAVGKPKAQQQGLGCGEAFEIGSGGHPSVVNPIKPDRVPAESPAAAQSKEVSAVCKPLRSGQGVIREF